MAARKAKLAGTVAWNDGTNFDGYALIGTAVPTVSSVDYASITLEATYPPLKLPKWTVIPIKDGAYDQNVSLYYNADLQPPGCRYAAYFYDSTGRLIAPTPPASMFDIAANPYTLSAPTLTVPTGPASGPTPQEVT